MIENKNKIFEISIRNYVSISFVSLIEECKLHVDETHYSTVSLDVNMRHANKTYGGWGRELRVKNNPLKHPICTEYGK